MPLEADFAPDDEGLHEALRLLIEAKRMPGTPHGDPEAALPLPESWPDEGVGGRAALAALAAPALAQPTRFDHPGFFAHMDPPTPWMSWAAAQWAAAMNQNLLHPDSAPAARRLERLAVDWLAPAFGMDGGHLVPGSTVANLTALWAARDLTGARRVIASSASHLSVAKAAHILGLEYVAVPVDAGERMRVGLLPGDLGDAIVVLTAGTTIAGAVDPLDAASGAAWRHVDAAWAGPLRLSSHADVLDGIDGADSVAVSAHKWLYQPKESALVLFADAARAHDAISSGGAYLAAPNVGLLGSHGATALPLLATLLAWGRDGLRARIDADMALAQRLAERVASEPALELFAPPETGVVVWRPRGVDVAAVRDRMTDAWVSTATIGDVTWLRSVAANPLADPDRIVDAVLAAR
nr:pyridoxal-dependent decarboxylase [Microbacterium bovistercoris]